MGKGECWCSVKRTDVFEQFKYRYDAAENANQLLQIVQDGHMLADHSYDHMGHNSDGPRNAYMDVNNDLAYFGDANSNPVLDLLIRAGATDEVLDYVNYTMSTYVRMPYSNNWRVATAANDRPIVANCPGCTVPHASGHNAMVIADTLFEVTAVTNLEMSQAL